MYEYRAKTVKIVDGDTVDIDIDLGFDVWIRNQRIRLYKVDTPEKRTRNKHGNRYKHFSKTCRQTAGNLLKRL